jgi:ParB family transcriptional regulator, chromosome partitioning protein
MVRKRIDVPTIETVGAFLSRSPDPTTGQSQKAKITEIHLPPKQPRRYFDPEKLAQLVASVQEHGILEPLLVRPRPAGGYELIAGERRLRAAKDAGLIEVPIASREMTDQQALQVAIIENLQREDLNPLEETEAILELLSLDLELPKAEVISLLQRAELARRRDQELTDNVMRQLEQIDSLFKELGRFTASSFRANRLPLLNLPEDVLEILRQGKLEYTKARAIAKLKDVSHRKALLQEAVKKNLSLVQIKERIKSLTPDSSPELSELTVSDRLTLVSRKLKQLNVDAKKQKQLEKLVQQLEVLVEES